MNKLIDQFIIEGMKNTSTLCAQLRDDKIELPKAKELNNAYGKNFRFVSLGHTREAFAHQVQMQLGRLKNARAKTTQKKRKSA